MRVPAVVVMLICADPDRQPADDRGEGTVVVSAQDRQFAAVLATDQQVRARRGEGSDQVGSGVVAVGQ